MSSMKHIATSAGRLGIERDRDVSAICCATRFNGTVCGVVNGNAPVMGRDRKLPEGPRI